jgi:hypothetical protein
MVGSLNVAYLSSPRSIQKGRLRYTQVADLAHDIDEIVVSEIESWQSVFGGKRIAVPV